MSATGRGVEWERSNSRWVWFTFPFLGYWTWAVFLYIGVRAQSKKWIFWGFAYLSPFVLALPFLADFQQTGQLPLPPLLLLGACVAAGPIHAFRVKQEYLLQLTAVEQREERNMQEQTKKREQKRDVNLDGVRPKRNNTPKTDTNDQASVQRVFSPEATAQTAPVVETEPATKPEPVPSMQPAVPATEEYTQLSFEQEIEASGLNSILIDINRASSEQMAQLPEIGLILAVKITQIREGRGRFHSFEEFTEVMELSPRFAERLRPYLVFE